MSIRVQFGAVPDWVDERCTSPQAMRVYVRLARKYAAYDRTAFPSQEKLADELGVTSRTIRTALTHLKEIGALRVAQFDRGDGQWPRNEYWLPMDPPASEVEFQRNEVSSGRRKQTSSGRRKEPSDYPDPVTQTQGNQSIHSSTELSDADGDGQTCDDQPADRFAEFWQQYPRRVGKKKAHEKFTIAAREVDPDVLIDAAKRYANYCRRVGRDREKIKHPTTWLHQGCWDDDLGDQGRTRKRTPWDEPEPVPAHGPTLPWDN